MQIYHYHPYSREFIGEDTAQLDPLEGKPMLPASSTEIKPPKVGKNQIACFLEGKWVRKPDHRGRKYWLADGSRHHITEIDVEPPEDALDEEPPILQMEQESRQITAELDEVAPSSEQVRIVLTYLIEGKQVPAEAKTVFTSYKQKHEQLQSRRKEADDRRKAELTRIKKWKEARGDRGRGKSKTNGGKS